MKKHVDYRLEDEIALITIDSPPANAFTDPLHQDFLGVLSALRPLPVRAAIITGTGRFFQAGGDMHRFLEISSLDQAKQFVKMAQDFMDAIAATPYPTIAAINGFALGGGLEMALACDIRIASKRAVLGLPEVRYGILAGAGGTQRLSRVIGTGRAKLLMYTARHITADQALAIGLVEAVTEPDDLLPECFALAKEIAENSPTAVRNVKHCVDEGIDLPLAQGLELEREYWAGLIPCGDYREGVNAWLERRKPTYRWPDSHTEA
ncbi:MAG: enoyl-CoA hydratase-related protein [Chloroflexales bacterium]